MKTLSAIRKAVIDYYANPGKYLDMSTLRHMYDDSYTVKGKTFEEVSGLTKLGSGHYSDVYDVNEKFVLKIVKESDTGYARFANLCLSKPDNPYLPKIYHRGIWGTKEVYVIERLEPSLPADYNIPGFEPDCWTSKECYIRGLINSALCEARNNPFLAIMDENLKMIADALKGRINDLHSDNIMFRGTTPVITDPTSDDKSTT